MNELNPAAGNLASEPAASGARAAGQMLREAREAQGISIEALAAMMKVTVRKLESLESGRHDELPDATFARALAQSVCRTLKIDATPVLEQLPRLAGHRIEHVSEGLNAPFRDHPSRLDPIAWAGALRMMWAPALLLLVAAGIYFIPLGFLRSTVSTVANVVEAVRNSAGAATASSDTVVSPTTEIVVQDGVATMPNFDARGGMVAAPSTTTTTAVAPGPSVAVPLVIAPPSPALNPAPGAGTVELRASAESWVEVRDGRNRTLLSRSLQPDETVMLDGAMPIRVKIGNAAVTELRYRGELIDLAPMTTENIARVQLK
jgi:cytoskeleton protein RodZ